MNDYILCFHTFREHCLSEWLLSGITAPTVAVKLKNSQSIKLTRRYGAICCKLVDHLSFGQTSPFPLLSGKVVQSQKEILFCSEERTNKREKKKDI